MKKNRNLLLGLIAIFWVFFITLGYFVTHKPFSPELAGVIAQAAWRLTLAGVVIGTAGGIGNRLLKLADFHPLVKLSVQSAFGLGILALFVMLIGLVGGFNQLVFALFLLILILLLRKDILAWWWLWQALPAFWRESGRFWKVCGVLVFTVLGLGLITALAPPLKYDALMYHLSMPLAYLESGRLSYLPWLVMTGMPQTTEMLYTFVMSLGGAQGAVVLGWCFGVLALFGLAGFVRSRLDNSSAWVSVLSLLAGYTFAVSMAWGYVDWLGLLFGLAALICLDEWRIGGNRELILLTGAFAGFAFSTKYTAGIFSIALFGAFCWHCFKRKAPFFQNLFYLAGAALLVSLPWLIRNWVNTGNPVYPFIFQGGAMDAVRIGVYQGLPAWGDWRDVLLLPWRATVVGSESAEGYSVSIGPLLLGLAALSWISHRKLNPDQHAGLENAAWIACLGIFVWVIGNQASGYLIQTRMYFSIFPAFAVLAAYGYSGISRLEIPGLRPARIIQALIVLVFGLNLLEVFISFARTGALSVVLGLQTEQQYREANLGWYSIAMDTIRDLPSDGKTILLYEPRGFHCLPNCDPDEILDRWKHDLAVLKDPESILASWRHQGFGFILHNKAGTTFLRENPDPHHPVAEIDALEQLLSALELVQEFGSSYQLYRIPPQ